MWHGPWLRERTLRLPTWRAWLVIILVGGSSLLWTSLQLHAWLSVHDPVEDAEYVVIEGWVPDTVVWRAVQWAKEHKTKRIYTTGVPIDRSMFTNTEIHYSDICALSAKRMGADPALLRPAPAPEVRRERTRAMAMGLKNALDADAIPAEARKVNVFTLGAHAWRSRYHIQRALGPGWKVGMISVPSTGYSPASWWKSSEGVKTVISELIAIVTQSLGGD